MAFIDVVDLERTFTVRKKVGRLRRSRTLVHALRGITFEVTRGEFLGYLGANGAGKSTTIKILTGILAPSRGRVSLAGHDPFSDRRTIAYQMGAMFGQRVQLWWDLPLRDSFEQLRYIYKVGAADYRSRLAELTELLDLGEFIGTPVRQLSLGQRIRGELAAVMLHEPQVLFLDEPTIGLDVLVKQRVRDFLTTVNRDRGVTIMLTTHDLADLEHMCSRLLLLSQGRVVGDGSIEELFAAHNLEHTLVVDLAEARPPLELEHVRTIDVDGPRQRIRFRTQDVSPAALISAVAAQAQIVDLTLREPAVEDLVRVLHVADH